MPLYTNSSGQVSSSPSTSSGYSGPGSSSFNSYYSPGGLFDYYNSSLSNNNSPSYSAPAPAPAPVTYTADDGSVHSTQAQANARNSEIAFQADFDAAIQAETDLERAFSDYGAGKNDLIDVVSGGTSGSISFDVTDPFTGETVSAPTSSKASEYLQNFQNNYINSVVEDAYTTAGLDELVNKDDWSTYFEGVGLDEELFGSTFDRSVKYQDTLESLGIAPEKIEIVKEGSIGDVGIFKWATDFLKDPAEDSDILKTYAVEDIPEFIRGNQFKLDDAGNMQLVESAGFEKDAAVFLDYLKLNEELDVDELSGLIGEDYVRENYDLTNSADFGKFATEAAKAKEAGSTWWSLLEPVDDLLGTDWIDDRPELRVQDGKIVAENDISVQGVVSLGLEALAGSYLVPGIGAEVAGFLGTAFGASPFTTAVGAMTTNSVLDALKPVTVSSTVDSSGEAYFNLGLRGTDNYVSVNSIFENTGNAVQTSNEALQNGTMDLNYALSTGIGNSSFESSIGSSSSASDIRYALDTPDTAQGGQKTLDWRDLYNPWDKELTAESVIKDIAANGLDAVAGNLKVNAPELVKSVEFATKLDGGTDIVEAAVSTFGADALTKNLPDGWGDITETAIRIGAGENRVQVLGDVYGEDLGLDNPLGKAGVNSLTIYDQTGDTNKALQEGIVTYFQEGGTLPDVDLAVPDYFEDSLNIGLPDVDFSGLKLPDLGIDLSGVEDGLKTMYDKFQGALPTISFEGVKFADLGDGMDIPNVLEYLPKVKIPELDFKGVDFYDLGDVDVPEIADLGINIPDLNFKGVDVADLGIDVGEAVDLGIDFKDLKLGDLDLNVALAIGATEEQQQQDLEDEEVIDPFADTTEEEDTVASKTPLSQVLVKTAV